MAATNFIAVSKPLKEALKSANLLKSLKLNTLISGEPGTGRHTLAKLMMPEAPVVHGNHPDLYNLMEKHDQLVIDRFETIENYPKFFQTIQKRGIHIVAVVNGETADLHGGFFSVRITIPPLKERPEDIDPLVEKFKSEVLGMFGDEDSKDFEVEREKLDISRNAFSLRRSIVLQYLASGIGEEDLLDLNEKFLAERMERTGEVYRKLLYLYEVPLIRAGTKRYKSQLKMSKAFGLNRNTLRKKIGEWREYL